MPVNFIMELQVIQQRIYTIRGQKVMLDFDLAELYDTETRILKQTVKRNIDRLPEDFMFQLAKKEWQEVITNCDKLPAGVKFSPALPFAFTEHGVTMLASILKSKKAIQMNISIVRAFIALRKLALQYDDLIQQIQDLRHEFQQGLIEHDVQLASIYDTIETLLDKKIDEEAEREAWENRNRIGFKPEG